MLPHPFGSLFSKLEGHGGELDTCLSIVLCLAQLCESAKQEVRVGIGLICQCCGGVTGLNAGTFTGGKVGDIRVDLSAAKCAVNTKVTEDLLCFVYNDRRRDKVLSGVTNPSRGETFSTVFFQRLGL